MTGASSYWSVEEAATKRPLTPRTYSNGLTQDEAVRRIITAFRAGKRRSGDADVFFIAGTGSGKSLVALNVIARTGGRGLVSTPTVNLQDQYEDAARSLRVLKPNGRPLGVASVKGRRRYECKHEGGTVAEPHVCSRGQGKAKEAKWRRASTCPYWSPVMSAEAFGALRASADDILTNERLADTQAAFLEDLRDADADTWDGVDGESRFAHMGPRGCGYFDAHHAFAASDVTVLSNRKWQIETELGRKPKVDVEVFDEADGFLDELFEEQRLTVEGVTALYDRVSYAARCLSLQEHQVRDIDNFESYEPDARALPDPEGFFALTSLARRLATFRSPDDFDDEKTWRALEAVPAMLKDWPRLARERLRGEFAGRPWASVHVENLLVGQGVADDDENIIAKVKAFVESRDSLILAYDATGVYFTYSNLRSPLRRILARSAPLRLWMSATFPSSHILKLVYGFDDPVIIRGEERFQGTLKVATDIAAPKVTAKLWGPTGFDAKPPNKTQRATREAFKAALHDVFTRLPRDEQAILIVHGKSRLLDIAEESPIARWLVAELEDDAERHEARLELFLQGERRFLASTRIARGVDFAGERCRNVVLIKDPLPNLRARRFQVLEKKWRRELVFAYADDIATRTLAQQIGRGLRAPDDWARIWLLDSNIERRLGNVTHDRATVLHEAAPPTSRTLAEVVAALPGHPPPRPDVAKKLAAALVD